MTSDKDLYFEWLDQQEYEEGNAELEPLRDGYEELEETEAFTLTPEEIKERYF